MEPIRDLAIVLRAVPYGDRSRIITALTQNYGRISAMAINSVHSKRFGGALDIFSASEWRFVEKPNRDLFRIEDAVIRRSFEGLRKDFEKLSMASVFNEIMLKLAPEREPCEDLFKLLSNALSTLEETPGVELSLLNGFLAKILQWSGSQPQLGQCLVCQASIESLELHTPALSCMVAEAAWICGGCRAESTRHIRDRQGQSFDHSLLRITPAALMDFYMSLQVPIRQVREHTCASQNEHRQLFSFLEALMVYHVPGFDRSAMKSLRFLGLESSVQLHAATPL